MASWNPPDRANPSTFPLSRAGPAGFPYSGGGPDAPAMLPKEENQGPPPTKGAFSSK